MEARVGRTPSQRRPATWRRPLAAPALAYQLLFHVPGVRGFRGKQLPPRRLIAFLEAVAGGAEGFRLPPVTEPLVAARPAPISYYVTGGWTPRLPLQYSHAIATTQLA